MLTSTLDKDTIALAIAKAAQQAADRGVKVTVELHERGFFSSKRLDVVITAVPK